MNWKEFFGATRSKIIITTILLVLAVLSMFGIGFFGIQCKTGYDCDEPLAFNISKFIWALFGLNSIDFFQKIFGHSRLAQPFIFILSIISLVIYNYIISCIVIYIFNRLKKK